MRVLLLSWDARGDRVGPTRQSAGLAVALSAAGDDVRLVTRLPDGASPPVLPGVEVHAVGDPPPVLPGEMDRPLVAALGFATSAAGVAARRLDERAVDLVHVEGWQCAPAATSLQASHGVPLVAALGRADVAPGPSEAGGDAALAAGFAGELARAAARTLVCSQAAARLVTEQVPAARVRVVPTGVDLPARRPGPAALAGPVLLAGLPAGEHRRCARALRAELRDGRRITAGWSRRPVLAVLFDADDVDLALRALARGVPLVAVGDGPVAELTAGNGAGWVVDSAPAAIGRLLTELIGHPERVTQVAARAVAQSAEHAWPIVAEAWRAAVRPVVPRRPAPVPGPD